MPPDTWDIFVFLCSVIVLWRGFGLKYMFKTNSWRPACEWGDLGSSASLWTMWDYHDTRMDLLTPHFSASLAFLMPLVCECVCVCVNVRGSHTLIDEHTALLMHWTSASPRWTPSHCEAALIYDESWSDWSWTRCFRLAVFSSQHEQTSSFLLTPWARLILTP